MESFGYIPRTINASRISTTTFNNKPASVQYVGRLVFANPSVVGTYNFKEANDPSTDLTIPMGKKVRRVDYVVKTAVAPGTATIALGTTAHPDAFSAAATATSSYSTTGVVCAADIKDNTVFTVSTTANEIVTATTAVDTITAGEIFIYVHVDDE